MGQHDRSRRTAERRRAAQPTRREFIGSVAALGVGLAAASRAALASSGADAVFDGTAPLSRPNATPLERKLGEGLDARLFTDLSQLRPGNLITPAEHFYVRTEQPRAAAATRSWNITIHDGQTVKATWSPDDLHRQATDMGVVLLECSGNSDPDNFGLISAARWEGVPLATLLRSLRPSDRRLVMISGLDDDRSRSGTSVPGASWIFTWEQLSDAFLATGMNGAPLPADHGHPVRLVVPGWYGCACTKWVNEITFVADDAPATSQMHEFAARTHQIRDHALARDFLPATIDHAAIPVRVERWRISERELEYRIIGIIWGGARPTNALEIQLGTDQPFQPVTDCPVPSTTRTWSLWSHTWRPASPGRYLISLRLADRTLPTRRLDMGFYRRMVVIDRV